MSHIKTGIFKFEIKPDLKQMRRKGIDALSQLMGEITLAVLRST